MSRSRRRVGPGRGPASGTAPTPRPAPGAGPAHDAPPAPRRVLARADRILLLAVLVAAVAPAVLLVWARLDTGREGFPLDDAWIHLTYARNLRDHLAFSYFPGGPSTQGSTSPLYTAVLAAGMLVTRQEKLLSYALGLLFQAGFLACLALWARRRLGALPAAAAVALVGLDGRVVTLAGSGMETSLFLFLVTAAFAALAAGRRRSCALAAGLAVWTRPDALLLAPLLAGGLFFARSRRGAGRGRDEAARAAPFVAILGLLLAGYFAFNQAVGGSLLPGTFAAKTAYYDPNPRTAFLRHGLAATFFAGAWIPLLPFALLAAAREAAGAIRGRGEGMAAEATWVLGLSLAYLALLPFSPRFERYLVPALPAFGLLALSGLAWAGGRLFSGTRARAAFGLVLAAAFVLGVPALAKSARSYADLREYHWKRHERTGIWLAENTPAGAVVATHDIGAVAFYSDRRVVDIVGLVLPDAVDHLHRPGYTAWLEELFAREGVTHLAVLRDWIEVVNVDPLFVADPAPEVMEVFPWVPGRTHLMPEQASTWNREAVRRLREGRPDLALAAVRTSLELDPESGRTWLLLGGTLEAARRPAEAGRAFRRAFRLDPGNPDLAVRVAASLSAGGEVDSARIVLDGVLRAHPEHAPAARMRSRLGPATTQSPDAGPGPEEGLRP